MGNMAEEYELQPNATADEPLLPRHSVALDGAKPYAERPRKPRRSRLAWCLCAGVAVLVVAPLSIGGKVAYDRKDELAEQGWTVDGVKGWLGSVYEGLHGGADDANFPVHVGYEGPTPTGVEPALLATAPALPLYTGVAPLVQPGASNIMQYWGNLSPYHSVESHGLPESSSLIPAHCTLDAVHWLQRHGARYPTSGSGPAALARRLQEATGWTASGDLAFLNGWQYKLGAEILTPFGRSQLYDLGVAARIKYGYLLDKMDGRLPVFRTESQNRMLRSAQNFAAGFFGIPAEEQYHLEVMIEAPDFNCTLAPYYSCPNGNKQVSGDAHTRMDKWEAVYLKDARRRLQKMMDGYDVTIKDAQDFMDMCAYETVALGYSAFCGLFTEKEWRGYEYRNDIQWWYTASFGAPTARAQGLGWAQELVARLSHTALATFNSTTNASLHDEVHFPLNDPLTVDFTHDTVFAVLLPALNLTTFAETGVPPLDHIPKHRSFVASKICPFATNMQVQVLSCAAKAADEPEEAAGWWPWGGATASSTMTASSTRSAALSTSTSAPAAAPTAADDDTADDDAATADDEESRLRLRDDDHDDDAAAAEAASGTAQYVRIILNDAAVPLTGLAGCAADDDGLCALNTFISAMQTVIGDTDFAYDCTADYDYNADDIVDGRPPRRD